MDAAIEWTDYGLDLVVEGGDLRADGGLAPAVLLSLFSDAALEGSSPLAGDDVRGWWGEDAPDRYGSELWRFERAKTDPASVAAIEDAARASLAWLVDDGILESVEVEALVPEFGRIELRVRLVRGRARERADLWRATEAYSLPLGAVVLSLDVS